MQNNLQKKIIKKVIPFHRSFTSSTTNADQLIVDDPYHLNKQAFSRPFDTLSMVKSITEKNANENELHPVKLTDSLAFMFESCYAIKITKYLLAKPLVI